MRLETSFDSIEIWKDEKYSVHGFSSSNALVLNNHFMESMNFFDSADKLLTNLAFYFEKQEEKLHTLGSAIETWKSRMKIQVLNFRLAEDGQPDSFKGNADVQIGESLVIEDIQLWEQDGKGYIKYPVEGCIELQPLDKELLKKNLTRAWFDAALGSVAAPDMEVSISPIVNGGARKATANIKMDGIVLNNIEVRSGKYGLFVTFPKLKTQEGWRSPIWFKSRKNEEEIKNQILMSYHKHMELRQQNKNIQEKANKAEKGRTP